MYLTLTLILYGNNYDNFKERQNRQKAMYEYTLEYYNRVLF